MNQAYVLHGIIIGFVSQWIINKRKKPFVDKAELVSETFLQGIVGAEQKTREKETTNRTLSGKKLKTIQHRI